MIKYAFEGALTAGERNSVTISNSPSKFIIQRVDYLLLYIYLSKGEGKLSLFCKSYQVRWKNINFRRTKHHNSPQSNAPIVKNVHWADLTANYRNFSLSRLYNYPIKFDWIHSGENAKTKNLIVLVLRRAPHLIHAYLCTASDITDFDEPIVFCFQERCGFDNYFSPVRGK